VTEEPRRAAPAGSGSPADRNYRLYLLGTATWFVGLAIQFILFPALVALVLRAPPTQLGTAQMAQLLPMLFLLLPAGALADRVDPQLIVRRVQIIGIFPPLLLAALLYYGRASYALLIVYALVMGTLSAVIAPAREGLLARVAPAGNLQRAVTAASGVQFGVQVLGSLLVFALPRRFGPIPLLLVQSALYVLGSWAFSRLRLASERPAVGRRATFGMIGDGLRVALGSRRLRAVMILNLAIGVFYLGVFLVAVPLLVRDVHAGSIREMALTSTSNQLGTIAATIALLHLGGVRRKGLVLVSSLILSAGAIATLGVPFEFPVMLAIIFASGICGGVGLIMGRTLVQEAAPDTHRSRVMALYTLSAMGGAPLGALLMGFLAGLVGVLTALVGAAIAMALTTLMVALGTGLLRARAK
jgi:MFS family permease